MSNFPNTLAATCFAEATTAIKRVHVLRHEAEGQFHAGLSAVVSVVDDAHTEDLAPDAFARRLWALRILAALRAPWSLWSEGVTESAAAAMHAVNRMLPVEAVFTPPADAELHPRLVVAEAASALGYQVRLASNHSRQCGTGWLWIHEHKRPVVRSTESAVVFGSATRAYQNACEHALELMLFPIWQVSKTFRVPTRTEQALMVV